MLHRLSSPICLFFYLCLLIIGLPWNSTAQVIRENEKKEKIIVYPDGSWQYFADYLNGETSRNPADPTEPARPYPTFDGTIEPLEGDIEVTQDDLFKIAVRRSQLARDAAAVAQLRWQKAYQARDEIERDLRRLLDRQQADPEAIEQLNLRLEAAKQTEADSKLEAQEAQVIAQRAEQMTAKGQFIVEAYREKRKQRKQEEITRRELLAAQSYNQFLPLTDNYASMDKQQDLILNPPVLPCRVSSEGIDEKSGNYRRDLERQHLFSHTDDRLRVYLKDKDYLRCDGYFSADGGFRYLTLDFTFAYPNAREAYGFIEKGSILTIKMLNGDFVNLRSGKMDRGSYDTEREELTYSVYYPIDRSQINLLKQSEVDAIRVFWSSGFEEYEVYQLDFFTRQLDCLEKRPQR